MRTLLIADDERTIREGIASSVDWDCLGITRVLLAADGREAYEIIKSERPDIAVLDIVMPEMTGIQVISRFRDDEKAPQFVIVSGYSEFDYAQEAIRYNVKDYILKPCDCSEIANTIGKIISRVERQQSVEREHMHLKQYVDSLVPQAQEQTMRDLLTGASRADPEFFHQVFRVRSDEFQLLLFSFEDPDNHSRLPALRECVERAMCGGYWRFSSVLRDCVVLVLDATGVVRVKDIVSHVCEHASRTCITGVKAAVSAKGGVGDLAAMYRQAWEAIRLFSPCRAAPSEARRDLPLIDASISRYSQPVREVIQHVKEHLSDSSLSLSRIASEVLFLNPDYLGRRFKKECGVKFSDYLMTARMEKAKRIMAGSSELRVYEVAQLVGLGDNAAYFGHVFRKYTGTRPSEYRKRYAKTKLGNAESPAVAQSERTRPQDSSTGEGPSCR